MPKTELIEMKVFRGFEMVPVPGKPGTAIKTPSKPEIHLYRLTWGRYLEVAQSHSANPYWHSADTYEPWDEHDRIVRDVPVWVIQESPDISCLHGFDSREDFIDMMKFHFYAEIIFSVVEE